VTGRYTKTFSVLFFIFLFYFLFFLALHYHFICVLYFVLCVCMVLISMNLKIIVLLFIRFALHYYFILCFALLRFYVSLHYVLPALQFVCACLICMNMYVLLVAVCKCIVCFYVIFIYVGSKAHCELMLYCLCLADFKYNLFIYLFINITDHNQNEVICTFRFVHSVMY
jgi:hypothetical protein